MNWQKKWFLIGAVCGMFGVGAAQLVGTPAQNALIVNADGSVRDWQVKGRALLNPALTSGFELTDEVTGVSAPVRGTVRKEAGNLIFEGEAAGLNLRFRAEIIPAAANLTIRAEVSGGDTADRAVTARLRLHLKPSAWRFGNSWLGQSMSTETYPGNSYGQIDPIHDQAPSQIPLSSLSDGVTGIGMAHSMKHPRFFAYTFRVDDAGNGEYTMSVPLGLARETLNFPNRATFEFTLLSFAGDADFRGAAACYMRTFPECFQTASRNEGSWALWIPPESASDAAACGVGFNQCEYEYLDAEGEVMRASVAAGLLVTQYSEPWGYWVPIPKGWGQEHLTAETRKIADLDFPLHTGDYRALLARDLGDDTAADRFPGLTRDFVARAIENTAIWRNPEGEWNFHCNFGFSWGERNGWDSTIVLADSNPALPSPNRWDVQMNQVHYAEQIAERAGVKLDVIYLDSLLYMLGWNEYNFRRDQWQYSTVPLTFARLPDGRVVPAAHQALSNVQFLEKHLAYCRANDYLSMGNSWNPVIQYSIAYLDVLGAGEHSDRKSLPPLADFATLRVMAGRKPISTMDYVLSFDDVSAELIETRANYGLLYGIYPGTANAWGNAATIARFRPVFEPYAAILTALNGAGWEVETRAAVSGRGADQVLLERWGDGGSGGLYFTLRNTGKHPASVVLSFRPDALTEIPAVAAALHAPVDAMQNQAARRSVTTVRELLAERELPLEERDGAVTVPLEIPAERTVVLQFQ